MDDQSAWLLGNRPVSTWQRHDLHAKSCLLYCDIEHQKLDLFCWDPFCFKWSEEMTTVTELNQFVISVSFAMMMFACSWIMKLYLWSSIWQLLSSICHLVCCTVLKFWNWFLVLLKFWLLENKILVKDVFFSLFLTNVLVILLIFTNIMDHENGDTGFWHPVM